MSIALQMQVEALRAEVGVLSQTIKTGLTEHSDLRFEEVLTRLKKMEEKYHMLNARLTKYRVDEAA
jgi:hypothetical protein